MRCQAPAKINLHLRVGSLGADGFHPLLSWMCTVALFDTLEFARSAGPMVRVDCDDPRVPRDNTNLIIRTGEAFAEAIRGPHSRSIASGDPSAVGTERTEVQVFGVEVRLHKRIPMGAGLGGGSSDGATTLCALNEIWSAGWDNHRLAQFAARFGSDLPFFFHGPSSICSGRGQIVRPTAPPVARWAVLILPAFGLPTPLVYRRFDEMNLGNLHKVQEEPPWEEWASLPAERLLLKLMNDLEPGAFSLRRELAVMRADLEQKLGRPVRMSGSGSSLFTLYDSESTALAAARHLAGDANFRVDSAMLAPAPSKLFS